ncbi:MAG: hypothetical protein Q4D45_11450 [Lachnospiraceae bacterium]|nr:hypothetical protein [Lachnospiraceae bacterium]
MNRYMWKKGLSMALAAAMMVGGVSVPAVYHEKAAVVVKAAEQDNAMPEKPTAVDGMVYATVNMEYADFFYGELENIAPGTSEDPELSTDKVASYRAEGMYDAVTSATTTKSTKYTTSWYETGVVNDETNGAATGATLKGIKDVQIAIPEALYKNLYDMADKNAKVFEYLNNATYSESAFKSEYKVLNADGTFSKMQKAQADVEDTDAKPVLTTATVWGDYQIDIANLGVGDVEATTENLYGIILTDEAGNNYGLLHSDNTWLQTQEFSWAVDDVFSVHGENKTPYLRTNGLNAGNTITKITYLLKDSPNIVINTNVYLKTLLDDNVKGSSEAATYNANGTKVKFILENAPASDYTLTTLVKGARHGKEVLGWDYDSASKTLTLPSSCVAGNDYVATFQSATHGDIKITFGYNKANSSISIANKTATYTGKAIAVDAAKVTGSKGKVTYSYYSDAACTKALSGAPVNAGTYYAKASVAADDNYNAATSAAVKIVIKKANSSITLTDTTVNYTGKAIAVKTKVAGSKGKVTYTYYSDKACKKKIAAPKNVGTYYVKASVAADTNYNGASTSKAAKLVIKKGKPTITVKTLAKTYKKSVVKKKKQTFSIGASVTGKGKLSYKKTSGSSKLSINKSNGKVTVKKGTKSGTYKIKVKVSAKASKNYNSGSTTKTVTVKVK